jgi:molybdenum cofactor cytidylyltransferase
MNDGTSPQLQIVVLAAGYSSRLGRSKALVRVQGVSLLCRTVSVLAPFARSRIVVIAPPRCGRYRRELRAQPATVVINPQRRLGLSSSVRCAIGRARRAAAVLLLPVDLVRLKEQEVSRLIQRWRGARRSVVARRIGNGAGTPLILPHWIFKRALSIEGDFGLRDLVKSLPRELLRLTRMPGASADVDTPRDLDVARRSRRLNGLQDHQPG